MSEAPEFNTPEEHRQKMATKKLHNCNRLKKQRERNNLSRRQSAAAWVKVRQERRALAEATLGWRLRLDHLLRCAAIVETKKGNDGEAFARKAAWDLFHIKWKLT